MDPIVQFGLLALALCCIALLACGFIAVEEKSYNRGYFEGSGMKHPPIFAERPIHIHPDARVVALYHEMKDERDAALKHVRELIGEIEHLGKVLLHKEVLRDRYLRSRDRAHRRIRYLHARLPELGKVRYA